MKVAVVTGPTGVVGTALVEKLVEKNIEVFAVCRPNSKRMNNIIKHPLVHIIECGVDSYESLPDMIKKDCDMFFHLAWTGTESPLNRFDMYLQNENIKYSLDATNAACKLKCKVFLGSGSQAEYGNKSGIMTPLTFTDPVSGYGMAKLCAGQMTRYLCRKYNIKHIWTRILSVYGKGDGAQTLISTAIDKIKAGERLSMTPGVQLWDYLYSEDVAEALCAAAADGKDGSVYVIGSGKAIPLKDYIKIIRDLINPGLEIGFGDQSYYEDQVMHLQADISALTADTGWVPKTSFEDGIAKLIQVK